MKTLEYFVSGCSVFMKKVKPTRQKTSLFKIYKLLVTVQNWWLIVFDKLGLGSNLKEYRTWNGSLILCRSKSTDINEVVTVVSGVEYPERYLRDITSESIIFDIGANIGSFPIYINEINNAKPKIYSFEPYNANYDLLKKNIDKNHFDNVIAVNIALAGEDGYVSLVMPAGYDSVRTTNANIGSGLVKSMRMSTYCHEHNIKSIDLVKMDIEGAEFELLMKDNDFISRNVNSLILEYHLPHQDIYRIDEFIKKYFDNSFSIEKPSEYSDMPIVYLKKIVQCK